MCLAGIIHADKAGEAATRCPRYICEKVRLRFHTGDLGTQHIGVASWATDKSHKCDLASGHFNKRMAHNLAIVFAFLYMVFPVLASEDSNLQASSHNVVSPLGEGSAGFVASLILVFNICTRVWPENFERSATSTFLVFFSTLSVYYVLPDITTSNALLLSTLSLQLNICLFLILGRHEIKPGGRSYTMSIHCYPPIIILTFLMAYFINSPTMYGMSTQLQWLPFTIPYLGVSVLFFSYVEFVRKSWTGSILPL